MSARENAANVQYDRQLRLWGSSGQKALEGAHVCLAGASALGSEALKALVLPGIGSITIVDGSDVRPEDVGADFFLEENSAGQSRAAETVRLLLELNPAVRGHAVPEAPEHLLRDRPDFFRTFSVVIACGLSERAIVELSQNLWEARVPLVLCRSVGFVSSLRIQVKEHVVIETHPDNQPGDLRLKEPFATMSNFANTFDLSPDSSDDHAHIPWPIITLKALRVWFNSNPGQEPTNCKHREEICNIIDSWKRKDENGVPLDEENFREAARAINCSLNPITMPEPIKKILQDDSCVFLNRQSSPFWIMCNAIKTFVEEQGNGALPLRGTLPDMTASTRHYVALQNIYRSKAATDAEAVYKITRRLVAELGAENVSEADVKLICKNSFSLHVTRGSRIADEYSHSGSVSAYIARQLEEPDPMMLHYVMLRASEKFRSEQCRAPGEWDPETDIPKLKACVAKLLSEWSCPPLAEEDYVHEMCRYGGAELHAVSAFMGGCVAQEVIKLITKQYIPVNNFFVHEAMTGNSTTFTF